MSAESEINDLLRASRCYRCIPVGSGAGGIIGGAGVAVAIYQALAYANGFAPEEQFVFGDPDAPFIFGDPTTGDMFGGG